MSTIKPFQELQFSDAFMFAATMEDEEICRGVLERILGIPIKKVKVRSEATLFNNSDYRGVRLDVYADDEEGTMFDVEMQTTDKKDLPKRSRVYQGQMDLMALKPGDEYKALPKSYIIFICTYDPFGYEFYRYTCTTICQENGMEIGDEAYKIYLSTKGKNENDVPEELIHFLKYVENASYVEEGSNDSLIHKIDTRIKGIKRDHGMEVEYMLFSELLSDERKEGRIEGRNEGRIEGRIEGETQFAMLTEKLMHDSRSEELLKAVNDVEFREKLYQEYGMRQV